MPKVDRWFAGSCSLKINNRMACTEINKNNFDFAQSFREHVDFLERNGQTVFFSVSFSIYRILHKLEFVHILIHIYNISQFQVAEIITFTYKTTVKHQQKHGKHSVLYVLECKRTKKLRDFKIFSNFPSLLCTVHQWTEIPE